MIEADPTTEITRTIFQEADDLLLDDSLELEDEDLQEHILVHEELPDEVDRITPDEVATKTSDVSADDLLGDIKDESDESIPFIDLTDSEE